MSDPIRWSNPAGAGPALYDPENNPEGVEHAVIDTRDSNTNLNVTLLTLEQHADLRAAGFRRLVVWHDVVASGTELGSAAVYVGELAMDLVRTNDLRHRLDLEFDFSGGVDRAICGPWTITENTVLGSMAETYSAAAFALHSPHDVTLEGNQVTQSDASGREFRLVNLAVSGYDNVIEGNTFGGGAGSTDNECHLTSIRRGVLRHQRSRSHPGRELVWCAV